MSKVGQDDLSRHTPEDQRHCQAVQDQVIVLEQVRVWRAKPCHSAYSKDDQGCPLIEGWQERLVPGAACLRNVNQTGWHMGNKECEQDDGNPQLLQSDAANLCLVGWEVVRQRGRPDLRAEVAGHADESACKDQSLCSTSARCVEENHEITHL